MSIRILIADDNALVRRALHDVLEASGDWEVIEAANGKEAIERAEEAQPALIILDLAMPLMDGFRTARELRQSKPEIPVLIHTLYWSPRVEIQAMRLGVRKVISKSESTTLIAAVKEVLAAGATKPDPIQLDAIAENGVENFSPNIVIVKSRGLKADKNPPRGADGKQAS
ncbi:MAG TPA: response regulator transcription factor [Candidatus Solibacter sp.]|nr:response regulator transcription factor [Candidatus Solibacter sp.]